MWPGARLHARAGCRSPVSSSRRYNACSFHDNELDSDCSERNLMMDASQMFPQGFHPVKDVFLPDARTPARPFPRSRVPIKYYYVDYGLSVYIPPDIHPKLVLGDFGRDQDVPELSLTVPYDPFKVDIFIIGNMLKRIFHDVSRYHQEEDHSVTILKHLVTAIFQCRFLATSDSKDDAT